MKFLRVLCLSACLSVAIAADGSIRGHSHQKSLAPAQSGSEGQTTSSPNTDTTAAAEEEEKVEEAQPLSELYEDFMTQCAQFPEAETTTTESPDDESTTTAAPSGGESSDGEAVEQPSKAETHKWVKVDEPKDDGKGSVCKNGHWSKKFAPGKKNDWRAEICATRLAMYKGGECSPDWFAVGREDGRCFCVNAGDKCDKRKRTQDVYGLYKRVEVDENARFASVREEPTPEGKELSMKETVAALKDDTVAYLKAHPEVKDGFKMDEFLALPDDHAVRFAEVAVDATMEAAIAAQAAASVKANIAAWDAAEAAHRGMAAMDMSDPSGEVPDADTTSRVYTPPHITNNSDVTDLVDRIVNGTGDNPEYGIGDNQIKDLKNMTSSYAVQITAELKTTFEAVVEQTDDLYKHWLIDTCKLVEKCDSLTQKKKAALLVLKEINKKCNETIGNLRKQKVTLTPPVPKEVGSNKVVFNYVNPDDSARQYYPAHSGNGQLDNGNGARMSGAGASTIIDMKSVQRVRGVVLQGVPQDGSYMSTFHVQHSTDGNHWTTVSDPGACNDTPGWNNGVGRVCHDTPNWYPTGWGHRGRWNHHYRRYYWHPWCRHGRIRYWQWRHVLGRQHNYPEHNVCHCGKRPDPDTCNEYRTQGWCKDGAVSGRSGNAKMGQGYRWPADNCAVCGKCATDFVSGQYNKKVESLFAKPVDARYVRIVQVKGSASFRAAVITGRSESITVLSKKSFVAVVGFEYANHPYTIQASNDGKNWKTIAENVITTKHVFSPPVETSQIRLDWEEIGCNTIGGKPLNRKTVEAMGFKIVRHSDGHRHGSTRATMHPSTDQLRGLEKYGVKNDDWESNDGDWSIKFNKMDFDDFLFASGDLTSWLIASKNEVMGWYGNEQRAIRCSSTNPHTYKARWYRRKNNKEDPWISMGDHHTKSEMLYGGNSATGWPANGVSRNHKGLNVFVRKAAALKAQKEIAIKIIGFDKDPGSLLYPDSEVRIEACTEAHKKEAAKEKAETDITTMSELISGSTDTVGKNAEFLQTLKSIKSRASTFIKDYVTANDDAKDWTRVLEDDATPIQGHLVPPEDSDPRNAQAPDDYTF